MLSSHIVSDASRGLRSDTAVRYSKRIYERRVKRCLARERCGMGESSASPHGDPLPLTPMPEAKANIIIANQQPTAGLTHLYQIQVDFSEGQLDACSLAVDARGPQLSTVHMTDTETYGCSCLLWTMHINISFSFNVTAAQSA